MHAHLSVLLAKCFYMIESLTLNHLEADIFLKTVVVEQTFDLDFTLCKSVWGFLQPAGHVWRHFVHLPVGLVLLQMKMRTPPTNTKIRIQTRLPTIRAASVRDKHQSEEAPIQCEWMSTEAFPPTTELCPAEFWVGPGGSELCTWVCSRFGQCFPALRVSGGCTVSYCLFVTLTSVRKDKTSSTQAQMKK